MVQGWSGQDCSKQDLYPQHRPGWPVHNQNRMGDVPGGRRRPMEIHEALEECCGIQVKQAFVAVIGHDNKVSTFMSPSHENHHFAIPAFFDVGAFQSVTNGSTQQSRQAGSLIHWYPGLAERQYQSRHDDRHRADRRRVPDGGDDEEEDWSLSSRKRPRARLGDSHYEEENTSPAPAKVTRRQTLLMRETEAIREYYDSVFNEIQQGACKTLAKAWVKLVEPKKQSMHPYTKGEEGKPDWWPKPWGESTGEIVRHKEPDHLYKRERVYLLTHILRLIIDPIEAQNAHSLDLRKMGVDVNKLEEVTMDALTPWFKEVKMNESKRSILYELFKTARQEEKYKAGGLDGDARAHVTKRTPRKTESQPSESDDGMSCGEPRRESAASTLQHPSPMSHESRGYHPTMSQGACLNELPLRINANSMTSHENLLAYPTNMPQPQPQPQTRHQSFDGMPVSGAFHAGGDPQLAMNYVPTSQEPHRRSSVFTGFSPQSTANGMSYQPSYGWPSTSSTAGSPASFPYTTHPTPSDTSMYMPATLPAQGTQHSAYVHPFDGGPPPPNSSFQQHNISPGGHNPEFAYSPNIKVPQ